ncbi:insulinase family protein [Salinicola aestuarinus]|uniref:insulinase family protein n=1 Tax=Salinicola aestuarinus TaxID=1949082 RepID=UPI001FDA846A|nr:insulinase family protein [Salinicola aestuarinus]
MGKSKIDSRLTRRWLAPACLLLTFATGQSAVAQAPSTSTDAIRPAADDTSMSAARDALIQSPNDSRDYRTLTLDNGLEVLLISDPEADKAAAAMDVSVGSNNDPDDMPGLAHFLEHMLFLGTEGYPDPDGYQRFIRQHGGSHNAFTADQNTNYFFDIDPEAFPEALDRFSQFFVSPQFNPDYVDRERHAVNSEYQARRDDDPRRINEALGKALNPEHPITHFSVGSLDTLNSDRRPLRQALLDFYARHYDANVMHLAVLAPTSLDALEAQVRERFDAVPDRDLEPPQIEVALARSGDLPAKLRVKSLEDRQTLDFLFPIDDPINAYADKPASYIANLLGHEGEGSLLARLRKAGWADGLSAGTRSADGRSALFDVSVSLTDAGTQHIDAIQTSLFDQIARIRRDGVTDWRFEEQARLAQQSFRFQQRSAPMQTVSALAMNMAYYPLVDVQYAPYRMDDFDADAIEGLLSRLTPDNLLRVYSAPEVEGEKTTRYFDAPYTLTRLDSWPEAQALADLSLPEPNPYIAEDLSLASLETHGPTALVDSPTTAIWHQPTSEFGSPRVEWRFSLQNPHATDTPRKAALTQLLAGWLNDGLNERFYPATLAGQEFVAYPHGRGVTLAFSGWRDHQARLMATVVEQMKHATITAASVERVKQGLERGWRNAPQDALYSQARRTLSEALIRPQASRQAMLAAIDDLDVEDVRRYRDAFLDQLYVQALAVGDLDAALAKREGLAVANALAPTLTARDIPELTPLAVPANPPRLHPQSARNDSVLLRYLQGADRGRDTQATLAVIGQLIGTPFFARLRTDEQLGYIVSAGYAPLLDGAGLMMLVQSPNTGSAVIGERIDAFLDEFDARIASITDADLAPYRQAVRQSLLQRDQSLSDRAERLWQNLAYTDVDFARRQHLAERVDTVTVADVKAAWRALRNAQPLEISFDDGDTASDVAAATRDFAPLPRAARAAGEAAND